MAGHAKKRAGPILITGCSTGIGRATAEYRARGGQTVYATAREAESLDELERAGARTLVLDVLDEGSMRAAVSVIESEHGAVGVEFTATANAGLATTEAGPYGDYHAAIAESDAETDESFIAGTPEDVARAIERAITARRPHPRYRVTAISRVLPKVRGVLGDRGFGAFLRTQINAPS